MLKKLLYTFMGFSLISSCNSNEEKVKSDPEPKEGNKKFSAINCYSYTGKGDTVILKVIHIGESITGTLVYNLKEKDRNKGTIQGKMRGNILVADYTFMSEGMQSVRQVAFKSDGNSFIEGYGEIYMQNDKASFKNLDSLLFNNSSKLIEGDCK